MDFCDIFYTFMIFVIRSELLLFRIGTKFDCIVLLLKGASQVVTFTFLSLFTLSQ